MSQMERVEGDDCWLIKKKIKKEKSFQVVLMLKVWLIRVSSERGKKGEKQ